MEETSPQRFDLSLQMNSFSSDALRKRLRPPPAANLYTESNEVVEQDASNEDELELSLGLSTNGRFGVDPTKKKLKRSSSVSNFPFTVNSWDQHARGPAFEVHRDALLQRTRSLPTVAEEEWRKRKEYQSMRRFEARKKRLEKMKSGLRPVVMKDFKDNSSEDVSGNELTDKNGGVVINYSNNNGVNVKELVRLQRSGLSASSNLDLGPKQSAIVPQPHQENSNTNASVVTPKEPSSSFKNNSNSNSSMMLEMPHVTTKEKGPNGRKIEGFLYRYKKGEEVSIVCVCHGMFLTPAEFVKHGGVGDGDDVEVEHPLKHIVVNPFPLL